jgi:hypothetical protein
MGMLIKVLQQNAVTWPISGPCSTTSTSLMGDS